MGNRSNTSRKPLTFIEIISFKKDIILVWTICGNLLSISSNNVQMFINRKKWIDNSVTRKWRSISLWFCPPLYTAKRVYLKTTNTQTSTFHLRVMQWIKNSGEGEFEIFDGGCFFLHNLKLRTEKRSSETLWGLQLRLLGLPRWGGCPKLCLISWPWCHIT